MNKDARLTDHARESKIRDVYSAQLGKLRPRELLVGTEFKATGSGKRADMVTIDRDEVLQIWEFKIHATYEGLGQILAYTAAFRESKGFAKPVRGVLAACTFDHDIVRPIEILNLGIEVVRIPTSLWCAGDVPTGRGGVVPHFKNFTNN